MLDPGEMARLGNRRVDCLTDTTRGDLNERGVHMELLRLDGCAKGFAAVAADVDLISAATEGNLDLASPELENPSDESRGIGAARESPSGAARQGRAAVGAGTGEWAL